MHYSNDVDLYSEYPDTLPLKQQPIKLNNSFLLLTSREQECAACVSQGKSAKEIGRILDISYRTVEKHIDQLKCKLDCSSVSKLIVKLLKNQGESVW